MSNIKLDVRVYPLDNPQGTTKAFANVGIEDLVAINGVRVVSGDYEPYNWNVLSVTLTARSFSDVVSSRLSGEQLAHYALLMQTKGARQYICRL